MLRNNTLWALALCTLCLSGTAFADAATAATMESLSEQKAVLTAQMSVLELQSQVAAKQEALNKLSPAASATSFSPDAMPDVKSVYGVDGKMRATLAYGSGAPFIVKQGAQVRNGWRVTSISMDGVTLTNNKGKRTDLGIGNATGAPSSVSAPK